MGVDCTGGFVFSDADGLYAETAAYSFAGWFKHAATTSGLTFYAEANRANATAHFVFNTGPTSGKASVILRRDNGTTAINTVSFATTVFDGSWHHIGYAQDASGNWQCYADGAADSTAHGTFTPGVTTVNDACVGALRGNATSGQFTSGQCAHVATWLRQLSLQDFKGLANGMPPSLLGPAHYWPLWISEATMTDLGSSNKPLGLGNSPTTAATVPAIALYPLRLV